MSNYKKIFPLTQEMSDIAKKTKWMWSSKLNILNTEGVYSIGTTRRWTHNPTSTPVLLNHKSFKRPFPICVPKTINNKIIIRFLSDIIEQDRNILHVIVFRTFSVLTFSLDILSHFNYTSENPFRIDSVYKTKSCVWGEGSGA